MIVSFPLVRIELLGTSLVLTSTSTINVREYRRGNNKWSIQRNWQQDDKNKAKVKYDMLGHHNAQTNTINVNKTWSRLQTT